MTLTLAQPQDPSVEECLDELGEALRSFERYPPTVLAVALRVHLEALLQALLASTLCSSAEIRAFVRELEREVLAEAG
jgi:hypothetical protein